MDISGLLRHSKAAKKRAHDHDIDADENPRPEKKHRVVVQSDDEAEGSEPAPPPVRLKKRKRKRAEDSSSSVGEARGQRPGKKHQKQGHEPMDRVGDDDVPPIDAPVIPGAEFVQQLEAMRGLGPALPPAYHDPMATLVRDRNGYPTEVPCVWIGGDSARMRLEAIKVQALSDEDLMSMLYEWYRSPLEDDACSDNMYVTETLEERDLARAAAACRLPPELLRRELKRRRDAVRDIGPASPSWNALGMHEDPKNEQTFEEEMDGSFCVLCELSAAEVSPNSQEEDAVSRMKRAIQDLVGSVTDRALALAVQQIYYRAVRPHVQPPQLRVNWTEEEILAHVYEHKPTRETTRARSTRHLNFALQVLARRIVTEHISDPTRREVNHTNLALYLRVLNALDRNSTVDSSRGPV